ncbi:MAG: prepilin-type N-terminal cleavage/methylation domain-containing protein [Acidobacteria bacterium]|nr:prepilin-type N-terminal cleavage/methylation domain-containing protein [Acidobacteriota bacterium]MBV9478050.1 prepilin-type N-terminal cleavage/methylation domain-containing protein [Acidobacteriota bacterium]
MRRERGYSLAELIVVVAIVGVAILAAYGIIGESMRTAMRIEGRNSLTTLAQRPVNILQVAVLHSRTVFSNDTIGQSYYTRIASQIPSDFTPLGNTRLPVVVVSETQIAPDDPATPQVGNCLLIARQLPPVFVNYDHDNDASTATVPFPIDRYRFELYYLRPDTSRRFARTLTPIDIVRFRSVEFADYFQLNPLIGTGGSFSATQKSQIVAYLAANGLTKSWDPTPGTDITAAFYDLTTAGANLGKWTVNNATVLTRVDTKSLERDFTGGSITGKIDYSIGFRKSTTEEFPIRHRIPLYASYNSAAPLFPSGLEIKIVGVGPTQRTLARLVVMANYSGAQMRARATNEVRGVGWDSEEAEVIAASRQTM